MQKWHWMRYRDEALTPNIETTLTTFFSVSTNHCVSLAGWLFRCKTVELRDGTKAAMITDAADVDDMQNKYIKLPIAAPPSPRAGSIMNRNRIHRSLPSPSRNRLSKRPRAKGIVPPPRSESERFVGGRSCCLSAPRGPSEVSWLKWSAIYVLQFILRTVSWQLVMSYAFWLGIFV